ncbi:MAG: hypothetical protein KDB35_22965 [Acidimicrobiales bacterium]|nr:hypothetical protein [Acidimicrobiales bacterium]MCB9373470.1 hypothetical protein [Microthrixaceae bacterium]
MSSEVGREHPALGGVYAKLERAEVHLRSFEEAFRIWVEEHADDFAVAVEWPTSRLTVTHPPPDMATANTWSAIAGDCVHNARSALDHLACQLVIANGKDPGTSTRFPLEDDPPRCSDCGATGQARVAGAHPAANTVVDAAQPYRQDWRYERMQSLRQMDDVDKHRALPVLTGYFQTLLWGHDPADPPSKVPLTMGSWADGEATLTCGWPHEMSGEVQFYLSFGDRERNAQARVVPFLRVLLDQEIGPLVAALAEFVVNPPPSQNSARWKKTHRCAESGSA